MDDIKLAMLGIRCCEAADGCGGAGAVPYVQRTGKGAERTLLSAKCPQKCDLHEMFYEQRMV